MCAATITAAFGMLALWMWGHFLLSPFTYIRRAQLARLVGFERSALIIRG
jgi:hypothetical protein